MYPTNRRRRWIASLVAVLLAFGGAVSAPVLDASGTPRAGGSSAPASGNPATGPGGQVPVYAYFYQWFNPSSWNRAKQDFPLAGKYSSDDPHLLRTQVRQALDAGVNGFLTSWKSTDTLNRRLDLLVHVAHDEHLDLGVVYEALDFSRRPLPVATVTADMVYLVDRWGQSLSSRYYGRPVIIWTGTDQYSVADVQAVRAALGQRAYLLAASKSVADYERIAGTVDGEAYYWSSADPTSPATAAKLLAMGTAVHAHHGLWIAPAASGFDGRTLGHTRIIDRRGGQTLVRSLDGAYASRPDAIGVISWNEWSENTYIEPGERYGYQELTTLQNYLRHRRGEPPTPGVAAASHAHAGGVSWSGLRAAVALSVLTFLSLAALAWSSRRRHRGRRTTPPRLHVSEAVPLENRVVGWLPTEPTLPTNTAHEQW